MEAFYGCPIIEADRELVESGAHHILSGADKEDVALLVVGDPFAATTHTDLVLRAAERKIRVEVIHNASIMNAVACCGLQLYNFGQSVSIPFFTETWKPDSFYEKIKTNLAAGFHTLCLLDIKVKEQTEENLIKGLRVFEPPRFMTVPQAIAQLLEVEAKHKAGVVSKDSLAIGMARVGQETQLVVSGTLAELSTRDFGAPLHSLVLPGEMHFLEQEMVDHWHWDRDARVQARRDAEQKRVAERAEERRAEREARDKRRTETGAGAGVGAGAAAGKEPEVVAAGTDAAGGESAAGTEGTAGTA